MLPAKGAGELGVLVLKGQRQAVMYYKKEQIPRRGFSSGMQGWFNLQKSV